LYLAMCHTGYSDWLFSNFYGNFISLGIYK